MLSGIRRILYAVTFDATEGAVTWQVMEAARAMHASVVLLGVRARSWRPFAAGRARAEVGRRLAEIAPRLKGYVADIRVVDGLAADAVIGAAHDAGTHLVMLGAGARALDEPGYVAPAALAVARRARQDVWICKPRADPHIEHVLCAADTTPAAGVAVARAAELCRRFNARLRVLSVMPEPSSLSGDDPDAQLDALRQAQKRFLDGFDLAGMPLSRSMVWAADPSTEVLHEAEQFADGVLVMGATSRSRAGHGGLGPTAEAVLRGCPSSVWIVRPATAPRRRAAAAAPSRASA